MQLCFGGRRCAFEHLLDQVDTAARPVELIAKQLIGRAGGGAKSAVHARAQDRPGLPALRCVLDEISEIGLHVYRDLQNWLTCLTPSLTLPLERGGKKFPSPPWGRG